MKTDMIYVCADDYGLTEETSRRIEQCLKDGALNKISILPNLSVEGSLPYLPDKDALLSLHLNLVEGRPLSPSDKVSLIISDKGYFKFSFVGLLMMSLSPKRREFENQIYTEICNQLKFHKKILSPGTSVSVDSHQHTHMIPLIFKTLMRAIKDMELEVGYVRIPSEPIIPYLQTFSLYHTYASVNIIKQWLLKFLSFANRNEIKNAGIKPAYTMGVLFSGKMDEKRIMRILPKYLKLAEKKERDIEMIFHPGYFEKYEKLPDEITKSFEKFYLSKGRKIEFDTLMNLKHNI